jgi:hypothetical protein
VLRIACIITAILLGSNARADADERIAVAPLEALAGADAADNQRIQALIVAGLGAVPQVELIAPGAVEQAVRKARRKELRRCEGEPRCLAAVGELVGASRVVYAEVGGLGEARVVYLKAIDVAGSKEAASTTLELGGAAEPEPMARAAAFRLLAPERYQGQLALTVDVEGAVVYVDGARVATSPARRFGLPVGTHALRVTHPEFQDFVRFVDIEFDRTLELPVELRRYPIVSRDLMHRGGGPGPDGAGLLHDGVEPTPWYRRWYTIAGGTAVVLIGSAILVGALTDGIDVDGEKIVDP